MINLRLLNYQRKTLSETFQNIGIGENFLKRSPVAQEVASRIEKNGIIWNFESSPQQSNNYQSEEMAYGMRERSFPTTYQTGA